MPNDCLCKVRVSASAKTIELLNRTEFSFEKLYPVDRALYVEEYGTKWDRYDYRCIRKGGSGIEVEFYTASTPPYAFFNRLIGMYNDIWLKCDWIEEGGLGGIFIGQWNDTKKIVNNQEMIWNDWCIEEFHQRFSD